MQRSRSLRESLSLCVPLRFPGFEKHYEVSDPKSFAYSFEAMDGATWYAEFAARIFAALDARTFLPVYRMCDGEFLFALKGSPEDRAPWHTLPPRRLLRRVARRLAGRAGHRSGSAEYGYESYSPEQVHEADDRFVESIRFVAQKGILALCFQNTQLSQPFVAAMSDWFDARGIPLHRQNFYHFYSVYVLIHGPDRARLLSNRRVLVITGLTDAKRTGIDTGLRAAGAKSVQFLPISRSKAMLDRVDLTGIENPVDLVLVGAGVGSANVLAQLEPLGTVCLDVGFGLSTLADPDVRWNRPYCVPDDEFDLSRTRWQK